MRVAYVVERFPVFSETFVFDELADHIAAGLDVRIIVLTDERSAAYPLSKLGEDIVARTTYLGLKHDGLRGKLEIVIAGILAGLKSRRPLSFCRLVQLGLSPREAAVGTLIARECSGVDILHCHFGNVGRLGLAAAKQMETGAALFVTFHAHELLKSWSQPLASYYAPLFQSNALLLPISQRWRSLLIFSGAQPERTIVHHVGVDVQTAVMIEDETPLVPRIVMVGRMVEKKGHLIAVDALVRLRHTHPGLRFHCDMVGNGPLLEAVRSRIEQEGISEHVTLVGEASHGDTLGLIAAAQIFILPSISAENGDMEGIPVVLMEAMARGVPVISTYHSGIPELVEHAVSGLLVPERDAEALAEAILSLLLDADLRQRLAAAGRVKVATEFNRSKQCARLRQLYEGAECRVPGAARE
jgi:colanic acid/amylovoran biosynthesis glycosyltransferase